MDGFLSKKLNGIDYCSGFDTGILAIFYGSISHRKSDKICV